jgi:ABC-type transport system involved in multi-copper enzyme maturation permease subunit
VSAFANVVSAELFKVLRKRRTYVVAGLWWGLLPILTLTVGQLLQTNLGGSFVDEGGSVSMVVQAVASPFGLARIALVGPAYLSPTFYIIVAALFAALLIGEERSQSMWKTVLVAQPNRMAVLAGKVAVAMIVVAALLIGALLASVLVGAVGTTFLPTTWAGEWGALLRLYAVQWTFMLAAVTFSFLMVFLTRNVALGMVLVFFLPALLEGLYSLYALAVGFQPVNRLNVLFQTLQLRQTLEDLPRYFFTNNLYFPARSPVTDLIAIFGDIDGGGGSPMGAIPGLLGGGVTLSHAALVMGGYIVVFGALLAWRFAQHDVD